MCKARIFVYIAYEILNKYLCKINYTAISLTWQNRASKVKERVLNCGTNNELQKLLYTSRATELELNWLVENYFTEAEVKQLQQIKSLTQGNLFLDNQDQASQNLRASGKASDDDSDESVEVIEYQYIETQQKYS